MSQTWEYLMRNGDSWQINKAKHQKKYQGGLISKYELKATKVERIGVVLFHKSRNKEHFLAHKLFKLQES